MAAVAVDDAGSRGRLRNSAAAVGAGAPPFTVSSTVVLHALIAIAAAVLAVLFAVAGMASQQTWRWFLAAVFVAVAATFASAMFVRPTLAVDDTGIRMRIGTDWIGAPWDEIESVTVLRHRGLSDGRIAVQLRDPGPVLALMTPQLRRLTDANRRLTGSSLAVSYGLGMSASSVDVVGSLRRHAAGRCPVNVHE